MPYRLIYRMTHHLMIVSVLIALFLVGCSNRIPNNMENWVNLAISSIQMNGKGPVYVALRADGKRLAEQWAEGPDWKTAASEAISAAYAELKNDESQQVNTIELNFTCNWRNTPRLPDNIHRGILGIELSVNGCKKRYAPSDMIARNLSFIRAKDILLAEQNMSDDSVIQMRIFDASQSLIFLEPEPHAKAMFRGNTLIEPESVNHEAIQSFTDRMGEWLVNQVNADGRMTYKYWPSRGEESTSNNMIRQFMATWCLARLANIRNSPELHKLAKQNLTYNLAHFYQEEKGLGYIEYGNTVKLGAAALATLSIVDSPERSAFSKYEGGLLRFVNSLWNSDGSFRTFYKPPGRNDNQNFYPGETLLLWAVLYDRENDAELLNRAMQSFRYYRDWHRTHRNPAFIPWHTQAYYRLWEKTKKPELRDFIFEMNDWLLDLQEWQDAPYPDCRGRFYHPKHPEYGPPHASSTGVYLEGLADACSLAQQAGDSQRYEAYRIAILRGFRSAMQLQFADDVDLFYVSKRKAVEGGLRSTVYDNTIRMDNVQHTLMAALTVLEKFPDNDFYSLPGK